MELAIQDNGQVSNRGRVNGLGKWETRIGPYEYEERVELSGGSFYIESFEGNGTTIRAAWSQDESG